MQRIPADARTLVVPLGSDTLRIAITPIMGSIRFSSRTLDPSEVKVRQGQAAATLETFWTALRKSRPATLTHRQATALAGDLYRGWAEDWANGTIAIIHTPQGWRRDRSTPEEKAAGFGIVLSKLNTVIEAGDTADYEPTLGPLVTRLLLERRTFNRTHIPWP